MENKPVAHTLVDKKLTEDVRLNELTPFRKMMLLEPVRAGLHKTGFVYPTAIQAAAIPLGKSGLDLLVQSKSGTGKTLIFCTIILEAYKIDIPEPQSLILAPTREIVVQIETVLNQIGYCCKGFRAVAVIGGLDVNDDRKRICKAKAIVATPGRLLHLIQNDVLNSAKIGLLVIDEADKLYSTEFRKDILRIKKALPCECQTIACSATFRGGLDNELSKLMRNPLFISENKGTATLVGIKQFVYEFPEQQNSMFEMRLKLDALRYIFARIPFKQCILFARTQSRAETYFNYLTMEDWPCLLMSGAKNQKERLEIFKKFREFQTRIVIATDLMARGVDSEYVNLVINLELPEDVTTYLHRVGRAGRFGSQGIAITIVASEADRNKMTRFISEVGPGMTVLKFPQRGTKENLNVWDFKNFEDCKNDDIFGFGGLAPLASQDHSSFSDLQENKENETDNIVSSISSINTKTFRIDSKDSALNVHDLMIERPECNIQAPPPSQKLTADSQQQISQQFPSSNTIDDASSIAADSLRSSQQDLSRHQPNLVQKAEGPTYFELLLDHNSSWAKSKGNICDLFDDYKKSVLNHDSQTETEGKEKNIPFSNTFNDTPKETGTTYKQEDTDSNSAKCNTKDKLYNMSEQTGSNDINKETFILSVATPSKVHDSIEEFINTSSHTEINHFTSDSDSESLLEQKHFPSPAHYPNDGIPDVVPFIQTQHTQHELNLSIKKCSQIEISPNQPITTDLPTFNGTASSQPQINSDNEQDGGSDFSGNAMQCNTFFGHGSSEIDSCGHESFYDSENPNCEYYPEFFSQFERDFSTGSDESSLCPIRGEDEESVNGYTTRNAECYCGNSELIEKSRIKETDKCLANSLDLAFNKWFDMHRKQVRCIQDYVKQADQVKQMFNEE